MNAMTRGPRETWQQRTARLARRKWQAEDQKREAEYRAEPPEDERQGSNRGATKEEIR
jgi:hypothetical protein